MDDTLSSPIQKVLPEFSSVILPLNTERTRFDCLLTLHEKDYALYLSLPSYPSFCGSTIDVSWDLSMILNQNPQFDHAKFQDCNSIEDLVIKVISIIDDHQRSNKAVVIEKGSLVNSDYYSKILNEIELIGWDNLLSVNRDFTELTLKMEDVMEREHVLCVKLIGSVPEILAEYPRNLKYEWNDGTSSLKDLYSTFCQEAEQYQEFWQVMEELDERCRILEPENPSRRDTYRKIAVAPNVSIRIDVDPSHPRMFPTITWLGSESAVFNLREQVLNRMESWEVEDSIAGNLERLLEIELPAKESRQEEQDDYEMCCTICGCDRLGGQVPSQICDNPCCRLSFHTYCLYEWLRSSVQSRKHGNKVFGPCPNCEQPISCKPPEN